MFQIIFGVALLLLLWWLVRELGRSTPRQRGRMVGFGTLGLLGLVLLLLVLSGRLHVLVAAGAALLPLLKHLPRLWPWLMSLRKAVLHGDARRSAGGRPTASGALGQEDACAILGLGPHPSRAEIIEAHRRLIQRMHPDRGGSAYLAARINEARDVLLASVDGGRQGD